MPAKPKQKMYYCCYCNKECTPGVDEYVKTRRKTEIYFHKNCFKIYNQLEQKK